jgi:hypothetical protein
LDCREQVLNQRGEPDEINKKFFHARREMEASSSYGRISMI